MRQLIVSELIIRAHKSIQSIPRLDLDVSRLFDCESLLKFYDSCCANWLIARCDEGKWDILRCGRHGENSCQSCYADIESTALLIGATHAEVHQAERDRCITIRSDVQGIEAKVERRVPVHAVIWALVPIPDKHVLHHSPCVVSTVYSRRCVGYLSLARAIRSEMSASPIALQSKASFLISSTKPASFVIPFLTSGVFQFTPITEFNSIELQIRSLPPSVTYLHAKITDLIACAYDDLNYRISTDVLRALNPPRANASNQDLCNLNALCHASLCSQHCSADAEYLLNLIKLMPDGIKSPSSRIRVVNPLLAQTLLLNRIAMTAIIKLVCSSMSASSRKVIREPAATWFDALSDDITGSLLKGGVRLPVLVKSGLGGGNSLSHALGVAFGERGIREYAEWWDHHYNTLMKNGTLITNLSAFHQAVPSSTVVLVQEVVAHRPQIVHKLFAAGGQLWVSPQQSLPQMDTMNKSNDECLLLYHALMENISSNYPLGESPDQIYNIKLQRDLDPASKIEFVKNRIMRGQLIPFSSAYLKQMDRADLEPGFDIDDKAAFSGNKETVRAVQEFSSSIASVLGSEFLGIDLVSDEVTGQFVVVDVNNFPSYNNVPFFTKQLMESERR
eukprot:GHVH01004606.1.p1 GENE.GHVH01004606.1~~GHVH01004606.1.p1  ORF type:complete len:619 (+),score=67.08 GHVH01004606.1:90-1946(+)